MMIGALQMIWYLKEQDVFWYSLRNGGIVAASVQSGHRVV